MAVSNVSICNLALQKLGSPNRIAALSEDSANARTMNACFEPLRDAELRRYRWKFTLSRATLAPSATAPAFGYTYAYPVPADFLAIIKPARLGLDWHQENVGGQLCILTNEGATLPIRYQQKITDPTRFDPCFVEMLACKLAWHTCDQLTQSNTKKAALQEEYKEHRAEARRLNAFEVHKQPEPVDEWLAARQTGQLVNTEWDEE